nr:PREDICTED: odorant receptor 7a-like [Linepithema humile]
MLWNEDVAYAMTPVKLLTAPVGGWPLQEYNKFALARYIISICSMSVELIMSYLDIYYGCSDIIRWRKVAHSIFFCNWHCMSVKLMKNILFVIAQSQQPIQLTAGKFLVVNLQTYMSILKTSFSYLSVLRVTLDT